MNLLDTPERTSLRETADLACSSDDPWQRLLDLGLAELAYAVDQRWTTEIAIVAAAYGSAATACPLIGRVLAARALGRNASEASHEGRLTTTAAPSVWLPARTLHATHRGSRWSMTGVVDAVTDLAGAKHVLLVADERLFSVDVNDAVATLEPSLDPGTSLGRLTLNDSTATLVADVNDWDRNAVRADAAVLLSAIATGASHTVVEDAVRFAGERFQFGRAIGSFQSVRHRLVDMTLAADRSWTALAEATARIEQHDRDAQLYAGIAALTCTAVYEQISAAAIQVYGGIGFTWEHPAHRHLKRARMLAELCGPRHRLLAEVADIAGLPA